MTSKTILRGAAAAAVLSVGLLIGGASPASALVCVGGVSGQQVTGKIRFFTEGKARSAWSTRARARFGPQFARWNSARNKRMNCYKAAPGATWFCQATASPCRP